MIVSVSGPSSRRRRKPLHCMHFRPPRLCAPQRLRSRRPRATQTRRPGHIHSMQPGGEGNGGAGRPAALAAEFRGLNPAGYAKVVHHGRFFGKLTYLGPSPIAIAMQRDLNCLCALLLYAGLLTLGVVLLVARNISAGTPLQ